MSHKPNNLTQPYIANKIGEYFDNPNNTNETGRALAHAALGVASAYLSDNKGADGAIGAVNGEVVAKLVIKQLYEGKNPDELTLQERENVRAIATLASGLVGTMNGGSFEDSAASAAAGYNSAVNNATHYEAEKIAQEARNTGANVVTYQTNPNDPDSWMVMSPDQAASLIALGDDKDKTIEFSDNFIKKTNKQVGPITLIKTNKNELNMLSFEYYKVLGVELNIGSIELPHSKFIADDNGFNAEVGIGWRTFDARAGLSINNILDTGYDMKAGIKGSMGGLGATVAIGASDNKFKIGGHVDLGISGLGADLEMKHGQ